MGKVYCPCGNVISDVMCPNVCKGTLIGDCELDKLEDHPTNHVWESVSEAGREVWECYECGRIAIDHPEDGSNKLRWYKADTEPQTYAKLLYPKS